MSLSKLRIAYIGNGKSTNRYHLPFALNRPNSIAVKTVYQRHDSEIWAKIAGIYYTRQLEDILQDPEVDVIVVTTPTENHVEMATKVLEAGKHCVVEKPLATSYAEARALFELARTKGLMLQAYQNRRFDSDYLTARQVIASGKLGDLFEVEMHYDYYRAEVPLSITQFDKSQAFIFTHACHTVDQVIACFGEPEHIQSDVRQLLGTGRMNDYFDLDFYYANLKVSVKSSYFRLKPRPSFVLYGTKGVFVKATQDQQEADLKKFYMPNRADFGLDTPEQFGTLTYLDEKGIYHEEKIPTVRGDYAYYYDALYDTLIHGKAPLVTPAQTLAQIRILETVGQELK